MQKGNIKKEKSLWKLKKKSGIVILEGIFI